MAAQRIQRWIVKVAGEKFTSHDCNEIKTILDDHADLIDSHGSAIESVQTGLDARNQTVAQHTSQLLTLQGRQQRVMKTGATGSISPWVLNVWASPVTGLELEMTGAAEGLQNEYMLEFTVSGDNFALTLLNDSHQPAGIRWLEEIDWEDGVTYQVSILDGLAIGAGWEAAGT